MKKFKVGDRVKAIRTVDGVHLENKRGIVVAYIKGGYTPLGVQFDDPIEGHSCNGTGKQNHCRYGKEEEFIKDDSMQFQVGDKIKVKDHLIVNNLYGNQSFVRCMLSWLGGNLTVSKVSSIGYRVKENGWCWTDEMLEGGIIMSKYDELKTRIEALKDGWNKEADDILKEILGSSEEHYYICIGIGHTCTLFIKKHLEDKESVTSFRYNSQCEKMNAFKKALLWLLDHSSIKKDEKREEINKLKEEVIKLNEKIEGLERKL